MIYNTQNQGDQQKRKRKKIKNRCNEWKTTLNTVGIDPTRSIITLNANSLKIAVKIQMFSEWIKTRDSTICCLQKHTLNSKDSG